METTRKISILRVQGGISSEIEETVVTEQKLHLYFNERLYAEVSCTPRNLEELALGNALSTGMIRGLTGGKLSPVPDGLCVPVDEVLAGMGEFLSKSDLFFDTGAMHSAAMIVDGKLMHFMEDVGRHNALDKTIGAALMADTPLDRAVVLTSGRIPKDMIMKIVESRVQMVVSRSAPTGAAVEIALDKNVTLCGFAREKRINIYTGRQRIVL